MSHEQPDPTVIPAIESPRRASFSAIKRRIFIIAALAALVALLWGLMELFIPQQAGFQAAEKPPAAKADPGAPTASRNVASNAIADALGDKLAHNSVIDALNVPLGATPEAKPQPVPQPVPQPAPQLELQPEPQPITPVATAPASVQEPVAPNEAMPPAALVGEMLDQNREKDRLIRLLQCQLWLNERRDNTPMLKQTLSQCYAIFQHAGVAIADYKLLSDITADGGVPAKNELLVIFRRAAVAALRQTHNTSGISENALDKLLTTTRSLFTFRKKGWQEGSELEAVIGRAEFYLMNDQPGKLREELYALPSRSEAAFQPFTTALDQQEAFMRVMQRLTAAASMEGDAHAF